MKTAKEVQQYIFDKSGIKTSVKKMTGSLKGYVRIMPMFQGGEYPNIPFELVKDLREKLSYYNSENHPLFCSVSDVSVYGLDDSQKEIYKKENKPKLREQQSSKQWGSKNSQMRLDKKSRRYAERLRNGENIPRYN